MTLHKKLVYTFGIIYIILLVSSYFIEYLRIERVDYWQYFELYPPITQFSLLYRMHLLMVNFFLFSISITFIFRLEIKYTIITGIIGFVIYTVNDISLMFVSTDYLILRIIVIICYSSIQIYLIYRIIKPNQKEVNNIKSVIHDMSEEFTITTIKEVSEKTKSDHYVVSQVLTQMINEGQISAEFFHRSKKVAFYRENI